MPPNVLKFDTTKQNVDSLLLKTLKGENSWPPPVWIMRQAGRYLPEYVKLRSNYSSFIDFILDPIAAAEATMQPMKRFERLNAAIIFSDILVVPWALGQDLKFTNGVGPVLGSFPELKDWNEDSWHTKLTPILNNISKVRSSLCNSKSLIGFAGAPWTLANYMFGKDSVSNSIRSRNDSQQFIDKLGNIVADWLVMQNQAGADVLMLFESWAETCPEDLYETYSLNAIQKVITKVRESTDAPIIVFPRANPYWQRFVSLDCNAFALSSEANIEAISEKMKAHQSLMGNLSPEILLQGGEALKNKTEDLVNHFKRLKRPWIVNLGHGILPNTPIANVDEFLSYLPS